MAGARGGGYGLDAELAAKQAAQYDHAGEAKAQEWMETLIGRPFPASFSQSLKDGVLLCELINAIKPGTIKKINNSKMPFKQMENISNFLKACRSLGVAEHSLFETVDLFEEKDVNLVIRCLFSLDSTIQGTVPEFQGPHIGAKHHTSNKREFTEEQMAKARLESAITKQTQGSAAVMERIPISKTGITAGADYAGLGDTSSIAMTSMGSYGIMDRSEVHKTGITMGADSAGPSMDNSVPYSSMGSAGIMERPVNAKYGITSGADYAGPSVNANTVVQANLGSYGIMERAELSTQGITKGADSCGPAAGHR
jgi:hypothetical protein